MNAGSKVASSRTSPLRRPGESAYRTGPVGPGQVQTLHAHPATFGSPHRAAHHIHLHAIGGGIAHGRSVLSLLCGTMVPRRDFKDCGCPVNKPE